MRPDVSPERVKCVSSAADGNVISTEPLGNGTVPTGMESGSVTIETDSNVDQTASCNASTPESAWDVRRRFLLPIIAPGVLQGKANFVVTPMLPIFARDNLGASDFAVGLLSSAPHVASISTAIPVGWFLSKVNYGLAACLALISLISLALLCYFVQSIYVFFVLRYLIGTSLNLWDLSKKNWLAVEVPSDVRSRLTATIAGCNKVGVIVAVLISGFTAQHIATRSVFLIQAGFSCGALALVLSYLVMSQQHHARTQVAATGKVSRHESRTQLRNRDVLLSNGRALFGAGVFCAFLSGMRKTWELLVPLQARNIGLDKQTIGILVAVQRLMDAGLTCTAAGQLMDRFGRKVAALPAVTLISIAYGMAPLCKNVTILLAACIVYGIGNGLSGGIIMSFQTGLAPTEGRSQFLSLFKMIIAVGPLSMGPLLGFISDVTGSLETAALCIAASAIFAIIWLLLLVRESVPR